ncbi:hypothetical protein Lal_00035487 [Lupinus albus]|nr:hypothetical protein Lal_00035487 [Lupinus albus]
MAERNGKHGGDSGFRIPNPNPLFPRSPAMAGCNGNETTPVCEEKRRRASSSHRYRAGDAVVADTFSIVTTLMVDGLVPSIPFSVMTRKRLDFVARNR